MPALEPGDVIDRFHVDAILGEGGMALVYRVRHRELGSEHALKVLTSNARQVRDRMLQEGRAQATLRHPNIVEVRDILDVGGNPGLLMELVEGPSLESWLESRRPTVAQSEQIFRAIVSAVAHAHARMLVHRDLKPANVLMARHGDQWVPKVTDFGIAKILADDDPAARQTRSGVAMGTPAYMSPEQIRDAKNVDARTDVFALGCILYELVTGEAAFRRDDIASTFNASLSGSYKSPRELDSAVPDRIVQCIAGCLRTDREQRLPDCAAILAVLDGAPVPPIQEPAPGGTLTPTVTRKASAISNSQETFSPEVSAPMVLGKRKSASMMTTMGGTGAVAGAALFLGGGAMILAAAIVAGTAWWWWAHAPTAEAPVVAPPVVAPAVVAPGQSVPAQPAAPVPTTEPAARAASVDRPRPAEPSRAARAAPPSVPRAAVPVDDEAATASAAEPPRAEPEGQESRPPRAEPAIVSVTGDAKEAWLVAGGKRYREGTEIPPGEYQVLAVFDAEPVEAGTVEVDAGERVTLRCKAGFRVCRR
jgi:serine/threonine-protein kinase